MSSTLVFHPSGGFISNCLVKATLVEELSGVLASEIVETFLGLILMVNLLPHQCQLCIVLPTECHIVYFAFVLE